MAKQRIINTKFWSDEYIQNCTLEEKLLFLYFLTNEHTDICGIYEISMHTIEFETGLKKDSLLKAMDSLSKANKVFYLDGYIFIKNFQRHQNLNPKVQQGICRSLSQVPKNILEKIDQLAKTDSLSIDYDSLSHSNSNSNSNISKEIQNKNFGGGGEIEKKIEEKKQYGNPRINSLREFLLREFELADFQESQLKQRQWLSHLLRVLDKHGDNNNEFLIKAVSELKSKNWNFTKIESIYKFLKTIKL